MIRSEPWAVSRIRDSGIHHDGFRTPNDTFEAGIVNDWEGAVRCLVLAAHGVPRYHSWERKI